MGIHKEWISYGEDDVYRGYLACLNKVKKDAPAVIVIQEVWGVNEHIQDVTERFAKAGYIAFSPDLFSRYGKRAEVLTEDRIDEVKQFLESVPRSVWSNPEERQKALGSYEQKKRENISETLGTLFGGLDTESYIKQLKTTSDFLRKDYTGAYGVGSVGFCLGGALSAALATVDSQLKAAIIFYGKAPQLDTVTTINCPVIGFYGGDDPGITNAVPEFAEAMKAEGKSFTYTSYNGVGHAFFNDSRVSYDRAASQDSFAKCLTFFNDHL